MTVYLVGAGPGDPGLATRRAAALLAQADVVVHDRLVPRALLDLVPPGALVLDVGKRPGQARRQDEINALLVEHGRAGRIVVRLKGGDPFVFGRGGEEATALAEAGVAFEVVPGVTAAFAAPAYGGIPVTQRGLASSVTVVTGRVGDAEGGAVDWEALGRAGGTVVVLMGMEHRHEIAQRLVAGGRDPSTPVLVVQWGTTPAQRTVRTRLAELSTVDLGAPATIVVGDVAGLALDWYVPGPLAGRRVVVTREARRAEGLVGALEEAGAIVVALPVVRTVDPDDGGEALARCLAASPDAPLWDWIVFTSALAVDRVVARLRDGRDLGGVRLAAVGRATAAALAGHHLVADLVAEPATAEGLVAAIPAPAGPEGGTVLYPRAGGARPLLAQGLRAKGWTVEEVVAYRTAVLAPGDVDPGLLDDAAEADAVTFTSPSTVAAYLGLVGDRAVPPVVACIGPVTAEAATAAGLTVTVEAAEHHVEGLVTALAAHFAAEGPAGAPVR